MSKLAVARPAGKRKAFPSAPPLSAGAEHAVELAPIHTGVVLVGSDGHYWPQSRASTAHRAFVLFCKRLRPSIVVYNGDAFDGARISRHPPIGWESSPTVVEELEAVQLRLGEIRNASPRRTRFYWPLGNHDARFNTRLAHAVPEYRNVPGTRLVHHFPEWSPCWAVEVGGRGGAYIKHRFKGGANAAHTNSVASGRSIVTGHTHALRVAPVTDYTGTRWGVECGTLASTNGPQFNYAERNPANHLSGFAVLSFSKGMLLPPELVFVLDEGRGLVSWRGEVIKV